MKITRGEFRGLVALAVLLAVVMAATVWCRRHSQAATADAASSSAVESALVNEAKKRAVVRTDSVACRKMRKSKGSAKRGKTIGRTVHDAASPLDDVNS